MSNKITPKDIYSNSLTKGNFSSHATDKYYKDGVDYSNHRFSPIDVNKFSSYFTKCVDRLNSIVKTGAVIEYGTSKYTIAVKDRIGIGFLTATGGRKGNNIYSRGNTLFAMLHSEHSKLVCKKEKAEVVEDFWNLKSDFVLKFHDLKRLAMDYVNDSVTVSDAFNIKFSRPEADFRNENIGYTTLNDRVVRKENVFVSVDDSNNYYSDYISGIPTDGFRYFGSNPHRNFTFSCFINDKAGINADGIQEFRKVILFRVQISGYSYSKIPSITVYSTSFDGIDVDGMTLALADEFAGFHDAFDARLEELKQKYSANFLLSEICDPNSDCAI